MHFPKSSQHACRKLCVLFPSDLELYLSSSLPADNLVCHSMEKKRSIEKGFPLHPPHVFSLLLLWLAYNLRSIFFICITFYSFSSVKNKIKIQTSWLHIHLTDHISLLYFYNKQFHVYFSYYFCFPCLIFSWTHCIQPVIPALHSGLPLSQSMTKWILSSHLTWPIFFIPSASQSLSY